MKNEEILDSFTQILRDLLGDSSITLSTSTTRGDVPAWDSFQYVNFIVAVEIQFGVKFPIADVESFATVGDIVARTQSLLHPSA
jgi:acyl carrier protein